MTAAKAAYSERDPLLQRCDEPHGDEPTAAAGPVPELEDDRTTAQRLAIILPCTVIHFFFMCGSFMIDIPLNEISEAIICRGLYGNMPNPAVDARCKGSEV